MALSEILMRAVNAGLGRADEHGKLYCGIKDLCDNLKNVLLVGALLAASVSLAVNPVDYIFSSGGIDLRWMGRVGTPPLALLFLLLVRQGIFVLSNFPGFRRSDSYPGKGVFVTLATGFMLAMIIGLLGIGVAAAVRIGSRLP